MKELIKYEKGEFLLVDDAVATITTIENEIKRLKEIQDNYKEQLLMVMEEQGILKIDVPELTITRKTATTRESIDTKALREELPDIYDTYCKISNVKGSLTIKIK